MNNSGFTANDIALNKDIRMIFNVYREEVMGMEANDSISDNTYGRTISRQGFRHNDRETHVNRLLTNFKSTDKYLKEKNGDVDQMIENIELQ